MTGDVKEFIDEVDSNGKVIAVRAMSELKERDFCHNVSLIIPRAEGGRFLIAKRAKDKQPYPNTWVCGVGGKARSGENVEEAAIREMKEEIGRTYPLLFITRFFYNADSQRIFSIFTTTVDVPIDDLTLDPREIQYCKAFRLEEIMEMIDRSPADFAPTFIDAVKEFAKRIR